MIKKNSVEPTFKNSYSVSEAAIFSTSARWINYRYAANAFNVIHVLKKKQINPNIMTLCLGDKPAFNIRNPCLGKIYFDDERSFDIYHPPNFSDDNVNRNSFRNILLRGPVSHGVSPVKVIEGGKFLIYMTGHGRFEFFKFREVEQIRSTEFRKLSMK